MPGSGRYISQLHARKVTEAEYIQGSDDGKEIVHGSVFMDGGLIKAIGRVPTTMTDPYEHLEVIDPHGTWVTPGSKFSQESKPIYEGSDRRW
jgi:imidazolonepropionase-like amidohydrolase